MKSRWPWCFVNMVYNIRFCHIYMLSTFIISISSLDEAGQLITSKKLRLQSLIRCTRRYTPGVCIEPVIPVWQFLFQSQNCIERYGCKAEIRANRFSSYGRCLKRCKHLINLYTEILAHESRNLTAYLRSQSWGSSGRRDMSNDFEEELDLDQEIMSQENIEGPVPNPLLDSLDQYWNLKPDIDYVDTEMTQDDLISHINPNQ